jgi:RNA polymerase sigma-70 factor (ECF subfamily)
MQSDWAAKLEELIDENQSMVYSIALRMTGDCGLAEEIAQDVFLELDQNLRRLESADHARYWLRRVCMNRSTDALRRRKVRRIDRWVELDDNHAAERDEAASPLGTRVEILLEGLPEQQRSALILRYQEEQSPEEIAALMGAPTATVKSWLQRGLKLLRERAHTQLGEFVRMPERRVSGETVRKWGVK